MKNTFTRLLSKYRRKNTFSIDTSEVEQSNLFAISRFEQNFITQQLSAITVDNIDSDLFFTKVREVFNQNGIVVIKNFIDKSRVINCANKVNDFVDGYLNKMTDKDWYEDSLALVQRSGSRLKGINNFVSNSKTLINVRQGDDSGMVDIFNPDILFDCFKDMNRIKINEIAASVSKKGYNLSPTHINCYVNRSVSSTRGFHIDSFGMRIKAFLYMSDVMSFSDGPYVYVRGSHLEQGYRKINELLSENFGKLTDTPIIPIQNVVPVLAQAGTLVISDQSGMHRGYPQDRGGSRTVAVFNYS